MSGKPANVFQGFTTQNAIIILQNILHNPKFDVTCTEARFLNGDEVGSVLNLRNFWILATDQGTITNIYPSYAKDATEANRELHSNVITGITKETKFNALIAVVCVFLNAGLAGQVTCEFDTDGKDLLLRFSVPENGSKEIMNAMNDFVETDGFAKCVVSSRGDGGKRTFVIEHEDNPGFARIVTAVNKHLKYDDDDEGDTASSARKPLSTAAAAAVWFRKEEIQKFTSAAEIKANFQQVLSVNSDKHLVGAEITGKESSAADVIRTLLKISKNHKGLLHVRKGDNWSQLNIDKIQSGNYFIVADDVLKLQFYWSNNDHGNLMIFIHMQKDGIWRIVPVCAVKLMQAVLREDYSRR